MTLYDREDRIECDECDTWAEHEWHEKAEDFEGQLLAALSKLDTLAASEKYASERYADACRQLDSVTANLEEAESRLEDREKQLGECTAGYQTLEREVAELRSRLEDRELTLKASEKLRHETNERLARESVRRNDLESSLGELQAQYGHTYNGMLTARADRDELQRSLDNERKDVEAALAQIAEQAKQYNELYTERSNLLYRLEGVLIELDKRSEWIIKYQGEVLRLEAELENKTQKCKHPTIIRRGDGARWCDHCKTELPRSTVVERHDTK